MIIEIYLDDSPYTECYIDDLFTCFLDTPLKVAMSQRHPPCPTPTQMPTDFTRPLLWDNLLSFIKMMAERTPSEVQIILGWELDIRRLLL